MSVLKNILGDLKPSAPERRVLANGIIDLPNDDKFKDIAAVHEDGTCFVAEGKYAHEDVFVEGLQRLRKRGHIPETNPPEPRSLAEIRALYRPENTASQTELLRMSEGRKRLQALVDAAAEARASDFEIIDQETHTDARIKIAGRWFLHGKPWTSEEGQRAIAYAFDVQDKGTGETTLKEYGFQGFSINPKDDFPLPAGVAKLRCSRGAHEGETRLASHLVGRLFYNTDNDTSTLEDLGLDSEVMGKLAKVRSGLRGGIIIGGETGDGKTTTLIRNLAQLCDEHGHLKVLMLEDPVEYRLKNSCVVQIPLQSAGDEEERTRQYRDAFRHFVRSNPDVGVITEIRDGVGGREALQFILSGHQLYTTLHVDCAHRILFRLPTIGVPAAELAEPGLIRLLIKQTLVPLLCKHCKRPLRDTDLSAKDQAIVEPLNNDRDVVFLRNPEGCPECRRKTSDIGRLAWWGYKREVAVGEVIEPDDTYLGFVRDQDSIGGLQHWLKPRNEGGMGGITVAQKMTELVLAGRVDPRDVVRKKGDLSQRMTAFQKAELKWGDAN
ncbi:putative type II/IV secretion system protein [Rhodobacteraceae bacterium KLH11]|nr:putative type II/IV secretion system protein [Rhodobacteraceae bacterium KLH11]